MTNNLRDFILDKVPDNKYFISNEDLSKGPFIIDKPGYYYLKNNIEINFVKKKTDVWKYDIDNIFGIPAGIIITTSNVVLDLNNFSIEQNFKDFILQRFFAIIQLNNNPFIKNKGPIPLNNKDVIKPENIIIRNGKIGLSSHQAILGNNNKYVLLENLEISNFEVTGINLNNVKYLTIDNVKVGPSNTNVPVTPSFSGLIFLFKLLNLCSKTVVKDKNKIEKISQILDNIQSIINPLINILYNYTLSKKDTLDSFNQLKDNNGLFLNNHKFSTCSVQGIKITGSGPSVNEFHNSIPLKNNSDIDKTDMPENISLSNVKICNLTAKVEEKLLFGNKDGDIYHIGGGVKLNEDILSSNTFTEIVKDMYELLECKEIKDLTKSNLDIDLIDFINVYNKNKKEQNNITLIRNGDEMGHFNKGVIGLRLGNVHNCLLDNIQISNISNLGGSSENNLRRINDLYNLPLKTLSTSLINDSITAGSFSMGMIISSSKCLEGSKLQISNIESKKSAGIGIAVNNDSENITLESKIEKIISNEKITDTYVYLVDEKSKNIKINSSYN